jgi:hypothetical protein
VNVNVEESAWRWVVLGALAYSVIATPVTIAQMLRAYWNAPEAARKNRQLLARRRGERPAAGGQA